MALAACPCRAIPDDRDLTSRAPDDAINLIERELLRLLPVPEAEERAANLASFLMAVEAEADRSRYWAL